MVLFLHSQKLHSEGNSEARNVKFVRLAVFQYFGTSESTFQDARTFWNIKMYIHVLDFGPSFVHMIISDIHLPNSSLWDSSYARIHWLEISSSFSICPMKPSPRSIDFTAHGLICCSRCLNSGWITLSPVCRTLWEHRETPRKVGLTGNFDTRNL